MMTMLALCVLFTVCADAKWPAVGSDVPGSSGDCLYNNAGNVGGGPCSGMVGAGTVTSSGTPTSGQAAEWTTATNLVGVAVTGTGSYAKGTTPTFTTSAVLGAGDGGTPVGFSFLGPIAVGSDVNASTVTLGSSTGTGVGNLGRYVFQVPVTKAVSGSTAHTKVNVWILGASQSAHPGTSGFVTASPTTTVTDENTAESGTAALDIAHSFTGKAFVARNASVTTTDVTTMYVTDSAGGTNNTATNVWSLIAGRTKFTSPIFAAALTAASGTPNSICQNDTTKEVTVNAALTCTVSSRKQKKQIAVYKGSALQVVSQLIPRQFVYKDNVKRQRVGFVAEELYSVSPMLADGYKDGQPTSIDQNALIATLTKAVQEQQEMIVTLKGRVDRLEQR
jgi:hypothetical protein